MYLPFDVYCNKAFGKVKIKLLKFLYGLKQAGELWYKLLISKFIKFGFKATSHDLCVFTKSTSAKKRGHSNVLKKFEKKSNVLKILC
jgi:hypothetical protein